MVKSFGGPARGCAIRENPVRQILHLLHVLGIEDLALFFGTVFPLHLRTRPVAKLVISLLSPSALYLAASASTSTATRRGRDEHDECFQWLIQILFVLRKREFANRLEKSLLCLQPIDVLGQRQNT